MRKRWLVLLALLPLLVGWGVWWFVYDGVDPRIVFWPKPPEPGEPAALDHLVTLHVQKRPLREVLAELAKQHDATIDVDDAALIDAGILGNPPVTLDLDGNGEMGRAFSESNAADPNSRGCRVRVLGKLVYDAAKDAFTRFDIAGVGRAWGNKMEYVRREIGIADYPWMYGIACELVTGTRAIDRIPPYNLLHYGGAIAYFAEK